MNENNKEPRSSQIGISIAVTAAIIMVLVGIAMAVGKTEPEPARTGPVAEIAGAAGYNFGEVLKASNIQTNENGGFYYLSSEFTNLPPFTMVMVQADENRRIFSIYLTGTKNQDSTAFNDFTKEMRAKYGDGLNLGTAMVFHSNKRTISVSHLQDSINIIYTDNDLQDAFKARVKKLNATTIKQSMKGL